MKLCDYCKKREGTLRYEKSANGQCVVLYLCSECNKRFTELNIDPYDAIKEKIERDGTECQTCGYTASKFKETFFLGCPDCYTQMSDVIYDAIKNTQFDIKHIGKRIGGRNERN